jgi:hypothetical protein
MELAVDMLLETVEDGVSAFSLLRPPGYPVGLRIPHRDAPVEEIDVVFWQDAF